MAHDQYKNHETSPASGFAAAQLDADYDPRPKGIYIGGTGDVVVQDPTGTAITFANAQAGSILPIRPRQIVTAGTTATGLIVLL